MAKAVLVGDEGDHWASIWRSNLTRRNLIRNMATYGHVHVHKYAPCMYSRTYSIVAAVVSFGINLRRVECHRFCS